MSYQNTYNLSIISGLVDLVTSDKINCENNNDTYYSINQYVTKANEKYSIIKYNKEYLSSNLISTYGLLRSIIVSNKKIVSFSPPKSISPENFMNDYPLIEKNIVAEDFVEGTMINCFFDKTHCEEGCWQIATRNTVGAEVSFYKLSNKTFNQMFMDACNFNNFNLETLNPRYCYSFVLQHPENRIVVPFKNPELYLVAVYEVIQNETGIFVIEQDITEVEQGGLWNLTGIRFTKKYEFTSYSELIDKFASANTSYDIMGVVIKNLYTGERTKIRNPIYEEVRHLRGNQPKLQYQYLCLRQSGKLPDFLKFYPETKEEMSKFRDQVHMFTNTLHKNYISCYVKKEKPLKEYPQQYRTHMFKIHEIFLNDLRGKNLFVNNTVVIKYVNELHPSLLMYSLNHNMRKKMVDTIKTNTSF